MGNKSAVKAVRKCLLVAIAVVGLLHKCEARILYVADTGDGTDGLSWDRGFHTISDALIASSSGDQIWVKSGTYAESLSLEPNVQLYGGFVGSETGEEFSQRNWEVHGAMVVGTGGSGVGFVGANRSVLDGITISGFSYGGSVENCGMIIRNSCLKNNRNLIGTGSGLVIEDASVTLFNCLLEGNQARNDGGGISVRGAFLRCEECVIRNNVSNRGGAVNIDFATAEFSNSILTGNGAGSFQGTAIYAISSLVSFKNCTIAHNKTGIGIYLDFVGAVPPPPAEVYFTNCIMYSSRGGKLVDAHFHFSYCDLLNVTGVTGPGNFDEDPLFRDPTNSDFRLQASSPCIDSGTTFNLSTDLDGKPRPVDVPGVGIEGPNAYDIGAYEFQYMSADLNKDGKVDAGDLLLLQTAWYGTTTK